MKIAIGSDHAGYDYKNEIVKYLQTKSIEVEDFGPHAPGPVDYADYIHPVAFAVEDKKADLGIILCGSGNGAGITANKHQGIRAALCWTPELARLARAHNDANILDIPARFVEPDTVFEMIDIFLATPFEGGRHQTRIDKIPLKNCK